MYYLVTGGCGFVGSNVAARLIARGERVVLCDNLSRAGSEMNLAWLRSLGDVEFVRADVRQPDAIAA
ncbi:MAG TPA: NAD-dependent epimerase/dehydratase family protein, partial [Gemmatimonadaceae bacterium]